MRRDRFLVVAIIATIALISGGVGASVALWWSGSPAPQGTLAGPESSSTPFPDFFGKPLPLSPTSATTSTTTTTTTTTPKSGDARVIQTALPEVTTTTAPRSTTPTSAPSTTTTTTTTPGDGNAHYCAGSLSADQNAPPWPPPASAGQYVEGVSCKDTIGDFQPVTFDGRISKPVWYRLARG
jgi:hypothetical protein